MNKNERQPETKDEQRTAADFSTSASVEANPMLAEGMAKIWTLEYRPFIMGGNVEQPMFTVVPVIETRKIKGFTFFSFKTPKGTVRICEGQTGGIIADSFTELIENIGGVPKKILKEQIDGAKHLADRAIERTNDYFFQRFKC